MCSPSQSNSNGLPRLFRLPGELRNIFFSLLANEDIKNLRLTCRTANDSIPLRFDRVFLSPHPRDIEVFRAVAQHDKLRHQITEIIYDDARVPPLEDTDAENDDWLYESESPPPEGVPPWYKHSYNEIFELMKEGGSSEAQRRPGYQARMAIIRDRLDVARSWEVYSNMRREQENAMSIDADYYALLSGLSRFPQLKRVTLTPAAHGEDLRPLYETPMIRALPHGFIYPVPRGWPGETTLEDGGVYMPEIEPWQTEDVKNQWRGLRVVTRALASHLSQSLGDATINEFVIDSNLLDTGVNCHVFTQENEEYDNIVAFLRQPGVKRLDLSLHVGGQHFLTRDFFQSNALRRAYSYAPGIEHVSFYTNIEPDGLNYDRRGLDPQRDPMLDYWFPLQRFFPVDIWTNLRHFGLVNFIVKQSDLLALLKALPPTLESLELSFLRFVRVQGEGSYHELLNDIRNDADLGWRQRPPGERPRIQIRVRSHNGRPISLFTCVSREADDFVYKDGRNPFVPGQQSSATVIGRKRDAFEPEATFPMSPTLREWYRRQGVIV